MERYELPILQKLIDDALMILYVASEIDCHDEYEIDAVVQSLLEKVNRIESVMEEDYEG